LRRADFTFDQEPIMLELIAPLLPRHPFEMASSLANEMFGMLPPLANNERRARLAHGTISWPLNKLAALGDGFYGDVGELVNTRTLLNYCRFSMAPVRFERLRRRAIDGTVSCHTGDGTVISDYRPPMVCPLCEQEALQDFGTVALLWPHQAALVDACWKHGVLLAEFHGATDYGMAVRNVKIASKEEVEFACDIVALCEWGQDIECAIANINERVRNAGFKYGNGSFCRAKLIESFQAHVRKNVRSPMLHQIGMGPYTIHRIVRFLTQCYGYIQPVLLAIFLRFLRQVSPMAVASLPNPSYARSPSSPAHAWSAFDEPTLKQPECLDAVALRLKGYSGTAVGAIKGMKLSTVNQRVYQSGRQAEVRRARVLFLRRTARAAWKSAYLKHGRVAVGIVASAEPRAYVWLMAHDRDWLLSNSFYAPRKTRLRGVYRLPEQQRRVVARLKRAVEVLAGAGQVLPLRYQAVLDEAGMSNAFCRFWILSSPEFARAVRPLFHANNILVPPSLEARFLSL
jgi:hypothetical protein